jgi:ATP-dependent protease ClpP protease subunit
MKTITIDGVIGQGEGEVSCSYIRAQLPTDNSPIEVVIHSEGGSVFEGFAIYDLLNNYAGPKRCVVASSAFSIASFIPMAFNDVEITPNGYMMLHNPYAYAEGDDEAFAKQSALLSQLKANMVTAYSNRTGQTPQAIQEILRQETYYNASQAVAIGLANRITPSPVMGRVFAKVKTMPHGVVAALFGAGSVGDNNATTKEKSMSEATPVAATVKEIKAAYPKARAEFIVKCMEQQMPMPQVAEAAYAEVMIDNQSLADRIAALEAQIAAMNAEEVAEPPIAADPVPPVQPVAQVPTAKAKGVQPLAKASASQTVSAKTKWDAAIAAATASMPREKAVLNVIQSNPGLREQMLEEANAGR